MLTLDGKCSEKIYYRSTNYLGVFVSNFPFLHTIQTLQFIYTLYWHFPIWIYIYLCNELILISQVIAYKMVIIRPPENFLFWWSYFPLFLGNRNISLFFYLLITNLYFVVLLPSYSIFTLDKAVRIKSLLLILPAEA